MIYPASFTRTGARGLACLAALTLLTVVALPGAETFDMKSSQKGSSPLAGSQRTQLQEAFGKLPLRFEPNRGQAESKTLFLSRGPGYRMSFSQAGAEVALTSGSKAALVRMNLQGSRNNAKVQPLDALQGVTNYLIGNDESQWKTGIPGFARLRYSGVYSGIDVDYYGSHRRLEYDFVVAPGADPKKIRLRFDGITGLRLENGDLLLDTAAGTLRQHKPVVYQDIDGQRLMRDGAYEVHADRTVTFALGAYDRDRTLVIDPILSYSTFFGGFGAEVANGIAVDATNNAYITGYTTSGNISTAGAAQTVSGGLTDAFVAKLGAAGNSVVYITYLGGSSDDYGTAIALDSTGAAFVTGFTTSTNFPAVAAAQGANGGGTDAFVAQLNAAGSALVYSTYLGGAGEDRGTGIGVDSTSAAYVSGATTAATFPTVSGIQGFGGGSRDAFVVKLSNAGAVNFSTFLGGNGDDAATSVAVNATGAYIAGYTDSPNFPTANAIRATPVGQVDAFLVKMPLTGGSMTYSTYLGGTLADRATAVAVDSTGAAYVGGWTFSTDFPVASAQAGTFRGGIYDGFVSKVNAAGSALVFSTYYGGNGEDLVTGIALDSTNAPVIAGYTSSSDLPLVSSSPSYYNGLKTGAFVGRYAADGATLTFSTYLGGNGGDLANCVAADATNSIYTAGTTVSTTFPTLSAFKATLQGSSDAFVSKFVDGTPVTFTVDTNPTGLTVIVDGVTASAPRFFAWAPASAHTLDTPSPQVLVTGTRYAFSSWSQGGTQSQTVTAGTSSASYTANFTTQYLLTVNKVPGVGGTVAVSAQSNDNFYSAGTSLVLTATPSSGYAFSGFSGDASGASPLTVVMSSAKTITATFACNYNLSAGAATFEGGGASGSFNITTGGTCPYTAISDAAWLTITSGGAGPGSNTVNYQLAANPGNTSRTGTISILTGSSILTHTVTQGPIPPSSITITTIPAGLQVLVNGTATQTPTNVQLPAGTQVSIGAVAIQGDANTRYVFANWSDGGAQTHTVTVPGTGSLSVTANYITQFKLNLLSSPSGSGTFTTVPASPDGFFAPNTVVQVTAVPATGAVFNGFTGALSGTTNPQALTLLAPSTVTALFTPMTCGSAYALNPQTFTVPPEGGTSTANIVTNTGCFWQASLSNFFITPFVTLNGATQGAGNGSISFTLAPNGSANPRTASINVQGQLVQILQKGVNTPQPYGDVPASHIFSDYIYLAGLFGEMTGCGSGNFCPDTVTTRARMAEFVIKAKLGNDFPYNTTPFFTDVPNTHPQFAYIQKMRELSITTGCSATQYCPDSPVTRGEISVFLIRGKLNVVNATEFTYNPTGYFTDMPSTDSFFPFVQKMKDLGITAGCSTTTFCPTDANTWGQISVFLIRSFNTP
ncbi:MAG: SBBP repeat-containing protein [Acidobacteria bacterium]|nr:SBBP repeat-containing protein [Acidobacteriota bacterium]